MDEGPVRLRRVRPEDAGFLAALAERPEVEPFLAPPGARDGATPLERIERSRGEPGQYGWFVLEIRAAGGLVPAGAMAFEAWSRRSRTASLFAVMLHPDFRGHGYAATGVRLLAAHLICELGYHRLQLECYGFNEGGIRLFERAGFVREGLKRKAYWRHGNWADSVLFALLEEDLGPLPRPRARHPNR
jgi:RimJ/RimL family protein N-acetyltransferase